MAEEAKPGLFFFGVGHFVEDVGVRDFRGVAAGVQSTELRTR